MDLDQSYCLSRYVNIRRFKDQLVLESCLNSRQFPLTDAVFKLLRCLVKPIRLSELLDGVHPARQSTVRDFLEKCYTEHLLTKVSGDNIAEEDAGILAHWEFHDLLFHTRSRIGRLREPLGATYRFRGKIEPEPALKPTSNWNRRVELPVPDLGLLQKNDIPFTRVLESRRSRYSSEPVQLAQLAEFLYRACRITGETHADTGEKMVKKVYPSGGSLHPLEIYLVASACNGLEPGLYHYSGVEHALGFLRPVDESVKQLLDDAQRASALGGYPAVLFIIAARFRRTAWKYQSIAYHLILEEVGALYQTMYLVATAMNLAPCSLGSGNSDLFSSAVGSNYYEESSVGEFMLGGLPGKE
jgi:SagB-type dehydrogenase family enzyme